MIPRLGEPVDPAQRYRLRPGVYAILPRDGRILVTRETLNEPEIQLPGGGIDPGEQTFPALCREVLEETGWSISRPRRLGAYRRFVFMPEYGFWAEKLCHVYVARPCLMISDPRETFHDAVWMSVDQAAEELGTAGDRTFVKAWAESRQGR